MEALKEKILKEGSFIGKDIIKVDSFLNHQIDARFLERIGREFASRFSDCEVDRILTVEASGIAIAVGTAPFIGYPPVVFAKKAAPNTMNEGMLEVQAKSFTKGTVSKLIISEKYLNRGEKVLILDDFLAYGEASLALTELVAKAGAEVAGIGAVIEKGFQGGSEKLRSKGYRVESLAVVSKIEDGKIFFEEKEEAAEENDE